MTPTELLSTLLPITNGRFSISLEPTDALALRYRGAVKTGSWWSPGPEREVDEVLTLDLPAAIDEQLERALRTWATVMNEVMTELAKREDPSLAPGDVLDRKTLHETLKAKAGTDEDFRQRWRWKLAESLPLQPEVIAAERALIEHFEKEGSTIAAGEGEKSRTTLEYVNTERRDGAIHLVVRLVVWERDEETVSIRDIKEQEVAFLAAGPGLEPERIIAFMVAMNECLSLWLAKTDPETLMPHDVLLSPQSYKSGRTVDDFRKLLRRKLKLE